MTYPQKFILIIQKQGISDLESHIQVEIRILQQDENEILSVDVRADFNHVNTYLGTITYQYPSSNT